MPRQLNQNRRADAASCKMSLSANGSPMPEQEYKRKLRSYSLTGPTVRAALDFATKTSCFHLGSDFQGLSVDELREKAIAMFEAREVNATTMSTITPENEFARQPFVVVFRPMANGFEPTVEINIKSIADLNARAKLYKVDATAYAGTLSPKSKTSKTTGAAPGKRDRWREPGGPI